MPRSRVRVPLAPPKSMTWLSARPRTRVFIASWDLRFLPKVNSPRAPRLVRRGHPWLTLGDTGIDFFFWRTSIGRDGQRECRGCDANPRRRGRRRPRHFATLDNDEIAECLGVTGPA